MRVPSLLQNLAGLSSVFLMGGFAEDALLHGRITRDRSDIDLLIQRTARSQLELELAGVGITAFKTLVDGPVGQPLAVLAESLETTVEVWLTESDSEGFSIVLPRADGSASSFFRLRLPPDTFAAHKGRLDGLRVQTISPLALCLLRAASAQTRGDAQKRQADLEMVDEMARRLMGVDSSDIKPLITDIDAMA